MEISQMSITSPQLKGKLIQKSSESCLVKEKLPMTSMEKKTQKALTFLLHRTKICSKWHNNACSRYSATLTLIKWMLSVLLICFNKKKENRNNTSETRKYYNGRQKVEGYKRNKISRVRKLWRYIVTIYAVVTHLCLRVFIGAYLMVHTIKGWVCSPCHFFHYFPWNWKILANNRLIIAFCKELGSTVKKQFKVAS